MSRATMLDLHPEGDNEDNIENEANETESLEAEESALEAVEQPQDEEEQDTDDDIPEKYKGKSLKEVVQMHQEVEKVMSRHSSEVGELRKVVDAVSYTHLRAHETDSYLVCRLLLEKKK